MAIDEHAGVIAERASIYETLKGLDPPEWDAASLCEGWRVRDVASHVHLAITINMPRLLFGLVAKRGDVNAFMAAYVPKLGDRPVEDILATLSAIVGSSRIPPMTKRVEIALDALVHHHDIALPLGREVATDPERLRWLADAMVAAQKPILSGPRVAGVRLIATDIDWHYGTGPEVSGPATALILAGCGRAALHHQLEGPGLEFLVGRS